MAFYREGTYMQARITAFDGLFLTKWWFHEKVIAYILSTMAQDPSRIVRRHVAMNACHSLALLFSMGELRASGKDKDTLVLEEEGNALAEKAKDAKRTEVELMIKAFRKDKDLGKNEQFRNMLMPVLLWVICFPRTRMLLTWRSRRSPGVDHEVRWQLLKLADMLLRGADEVAPKMTVRLPPTPVTEFPPPLPVVKFKSRPTIKTELPMRSPLAPLPTTPKIKLLPSGATPTSTAVSLPFREVKAVPVSARPSNTPASSAPKQNLRIPAKPAKVIQKHVPKAQSGGMSLLHLRACRNLLKKIQTNKHAALFNQPVDPVRDKAPK
jgi:transcription initiation factor TFIID subunit 2